MKGTLTSVSIILVFVSTGWIETCAAKNDPEEGVSEMSLTLQSTAFEAEAMIPTKYTCDGEDISPPLTWDHVPDGTQSLALICDDPDAPGTTWVHWVMFNIPPGQDTLAEALSTDATLANGTIQGITDFGNHGYGGPCPPGGTHRYYFNLYALDTSLDLDSNARKGDLIEAMQGHILAQAELMARYSRSR